MCLNRIYGILFVTMEVVRCSFLLFASPGQDFVNRNTLTCSALQFFVKFMTLCFWSNHVIIAIIRYFFVVFPIEVHNKYPSREQKNALFSRLVRLVPSYLLPVT